ncbi:MAG: acetoin utilization protein AcuC [Candidatus Fervidibacter sp.]|uniref:acetoin utilization protein AcuC n=1 Tax=Candidatus Fervidibacter sp. TaxID=3100871 RepID=UPI00404A72ED
MTTRVAFIDTSPFWEFDYGPTHPLKMWRLKLVQELQNFYGLLELVDLTEPRPATQDEVLAFHDPDYIEALAKADNGVWAPGLARYGLGTPDCPLIEGVYTTSMLVAGASVLAAEIVAQGKADTAFNMAGGLHHAMPSYASGFCYINDPVVAIHKLLQRFERVAYIDIDAHHGDGVQVAFYRDPRVLTISLHENGRYLFPGTGFEGEMGEGEGFGFSLNVPFLPYSGDDVYLQALDEIVLPALETFKPQAIVTQLGTDALHDDPITHWNLTTHNYLKAIQAFKEMNLPWVALGGGGYNVANVCRAWTLALATMVGVELPENIPERWHPLAQRYGVFLDRLRDEKPTASPQVAKGDIERVINWLKQNHPLFR